MRDRELHPGVLIRQELEARGMTDEDFAARSGLQLPVVRGILHGSARIDEAAAAGIGRAFGTSAQMWLNVQQLYDNVTTNYFR